VQGNPGLSASCASYVSCARELLCECMLCKRTLAWLATTRQKHKHAQRFARGPDAQLTQCAAAHAQKQSNARMVSGAQPYLVSVQQLVPQLAHVIQHAVQRPACQRRRAAPARVSPLEQHQHHAPVDVSGYDHSDCRAHVDERGDHVGG